MAKRTSRPCSAQGSHQGSERNSSMRRSVTSTDNDASHKGGNGDGGAQLQQRPSDSATIEPIEEVGGD
eukprot:scaffold12074_cov24-Tisochrysis_lutea.AAC.2